MKWLRNMGLFIVVCVAIMIFANYYLGLGVL